MNNRQWLIIFLFLAGVYACRKEFTDEVFMAFRTPSNFPAPVYHFSTNTPTKAGFELGRALFYEKMLSADNTVSCGNCHIQTSAFTHHGHSLSHGILDRLGTRNSPPIMNLAWNSTFMWDGGVFDLDLQAIAPITNHLEMGESMENVLNKLRGSAKYPALFTKAYGSPEINTANFLKSLSQFMLMCISSNSKYDSVKRQEGGKAFTPEEQRGFTLFKQRCSTSHAEPFFTDGSFRNNGISISNTNDEGRYLVTQNDSDKYKFRVPSLRNLGFTAPYMHDGRFYTLEAVLDHYAGQVQKTFNLDPVFLSGNVAGIALETNERKSIIAFLNTLNDRSFLLDKKLSEQ